MVNHWQLKPAQIALELTEREFADPKTARRLLPNTVRRVTQSILMTLVPAIPA
jgi:sensor c-di-GMP phosphodiesterase-like protein